MSMLKDLSRLYQMQNGTVSESTHKSGVAVENFESLLNIALNLQSEVDSLKGCHRTNKTPRVELTREDEVLYGGNSEYDEAEDTVNFAKYG